jgi:hypothetical protein
VSDSEIAHEALAALYHRRRPSAPLPGSFHPGEIALVIACTEGAGSALTKRLMHQDALRGACLVSRGGPPTVRFVWGRREHFMAHAARGRAEAEREAGSRARPQQGETGLVPLQAVSEAWAKLAEVTASRAPADPTPKSPRTEK